MKSSFVNLKQDAHSASLNGNSGARIEFKNIDSSMRVVKCIPDSTKRDVQSLNKQINFKPIGDMHPVKIFQQARLHNELQIEMEYINGLSGSDYAKFADTKVIESTIEATQYYFSTLQRDARIETLNPEVYRSKLREIKTKVLNNAHLSDELKEICFSRIEQQIGRLNAITFKYPSSFCHGDFTLSNIIFQRTTEKFYLIDFLEVPINSYLIDYAKLVQDLKWGWSTRHDTAQSKLKNRIMGDHILRELAHFTTDFLQTTDLLENLNMIRIVPYCRDRLTEQWLLEYFWRSK